MSTITRMETAARMSKIVIHQETIYLCGQVASNTEETIAPQTENMLSKVDALLEQVNSSREHILSATIYIRDMKDFAAMNAIWDAWVAAGEKPARACVEARMARPEVLVEMSVVAGCLIADSPSYKLA